MNEPNKIAMRVSIVSIVVNVILSVFKLLAGLLAGSGAMVSDAIHSASDVFSTVIVMIGVTISGKKSDKEHPYGHDRMECVASILLAVVLFATGLVYATSAVTVFFRDMKEVVGILLQIGMWVTPIMWNFETMVQIPGWAITVLKLNPMYYIVSGYRNALINHIGFWEDMGLTVYFWVVTAVILFLGTTVFKRLRPHFADVL